MEDLHWADRSTRDLVAFLATALRSGRVLVVVTFRSDELHPPPPAAPAAGRAGPQPPGRAVGAAAVQPRGAGRSAGRPARRRPARPAGRRRRRAFGGQSVLRRGVAAGRRGHRPWDATAQLAGGLLARAVRLGERTQQLLRVAAAAGPGVAQPLLEVVAGMDEAALLAYNATEALVALGRWDQAEQVSRQGLKGAPSDAASAALPFARAALELGRGDLDAAPPRPPGRPQPPNGSGSASSTGPPTPASAKPRRCWPPPATATPPPKYWVAPPPSQQPPDRPGAVHQPHSSGTSWKGLVGLLLHDLEPGAGDQLGYGAAKLRARGRIAAAGQDEGGGGKNPSRNARSLGATSTNQRTNRPHERR